MFRRKRKQNDFSEEIKAHIQLECERLQGQGLSEEDARAAARWAFGNMMRAEERFYESRRWLWWDHLRQDVRFGLRMLRKSPGFTIVAVLTLALGIGANTAIFSLVNAVALRSLPVPDPQQLFLLQWTARHEPQSNFNWGYGGCPGGRGDSSSLPTDCSFSYPMFERVRSMGDLFSGVFSYAPATADLRVERHLERVNGMYVSGEFFSTLGSQAAVGRTLNADDDVAGAEPVMVLSYRYWQSELGGDAAVVGRTATVNLKPVLIVGITSHDFPDLNPGIPVNFWMSLATQSIVSQKAENSLWLSHFDET
jgi:hypothetical protein